MPCLNNPCFLGRNSSLPRSAKIFGEASVAPPKMPCFVRSSASSNLIAPRPHLLQEPDAEPSGITAELDVLQLRSTVTWPYHCYLPCLSGASEAAASAAPAAPAAAPVVGPTEIQESEETEELRHRALFFRHQLGKLRI